MIPSDRDWQAMGHYARMRWARVNTPPAGTSPTPMSADDVRGYWLRIRRAQLLTAERFAVPVRAPRCFP